MAKPLGKYVGHLSNGHTITVNHYRFPNTLEREILIRGKMLEVLVHQKVDATIESFEYIPA